MNGVIARGIKTPIIRAEDDLALIVTKAILAACKDENFKLNHKDIIAITEGVVAISNNNFININKVAKDIKSKLKSSHIGIVYPIFSRNRFSVILKAIAKSANEVTILMPYPYDEVGNPNINQNDLDKLILKDNIVTNDKLFYEFKHPYTNVNIINYYKDIVKAENVKVNFIFSNDPATILNYTNDIIVAEVHRRHERLSFFKKLFANVITLADIANKENSETGYNTEYGLLGSNVATPESLKLFPRKDLTLLKRVQELIYLETSKHVEVFVFGDGAFKDPTSGIWELADPVVSPFYTEGLMGYPSEIKIKMLAETKFKHLTGNALEEAIAAEKKTIVKDSDQQLGTTPRKYLDLLGSLADLVAGSGDRQTPVVLIQNYLK